MASVAGDRSAVYRIWATARSLAWIEWRVLLLALHLLPLIDLSLRLGGLARTRQRLAAADRWLPARRTDLTNEAMLPRQFGRAISIAGRRSLWRCSCLRQALLLQWLLRRRGIETALRIGVQRDDGGHALSAHAWVERDGVILIGGEQSIDRFQPII